MGGEGVLGTGIGDRRAERTPAQYACKTTKEAVTPCSYLELERKTKRAKYIARHDHRKLWGSA